MQHSALLVTFALTLCLLLTVAAGPYPDGFDETFCTPSPNDGGKELPSLPDDYVARCEWNDHIARKSIYMREYVSVSNNIGAVEMTGVLQPGITTKYITSASTGELFLIYDADKIAFEDGNCVVSNLSSTDEFALPIKKDPKIPGAYTLLSGRSLLTLGSKKVGSIMYNGTEKKNGVWCDKWVGCLFEPNGQMTMQVTYHFSSKEWFAAGGYKSAPVSIHAKGRYSPSKTVDIEQSFNYIYYSQTLPSENPEYLARIFETPEHAYCKGRQSLYQLPEVPSHFGFRAEVINPIAKEIMYSQEWYDLQSNYTRIDYKNPPTGNSSVDADQSPSSMINDFNTGVSYIIDKFSKKCVAKPIVGGEFDSLPVTATKARLKSPKEFFNFDNLSKYPYQYMGEHIVRNVPCNAWISYRPFPYPDSASNATYEWYFATKDTVIKAGDLVENLEPMRLVIRSAQLNVNIEYNIYRFSEAVPDPAVFDVRNCFEESGSTSFEMELEGNDTKDNMNTNVQLLRYWFQLSVEGFAGVRPIRVQDIEFVFYGKNLGVRFTLLGPAPIDGDVNNNIVQASLLEATNRLTESFTSGIFRVFFLASPNSPEIVFKPVANGLRVIERKDTPGSYKPANPTTTPKADMSTTPKANMSTTPKANMSTTPKANMSTTPKANMSTTPKANISATTPPSTKSSVPPVTVVKPGRVVHGPGMTSGDTAGLGIGMLILGVLLAIAGILLFRRLKPVPYNTLRTT